MNYLTKRQSQLLDSFFNDYTPTQTFGKGIDIYKQGDCYVLELDMPGFNKEDIQINYKDGVLNIKGQQSQEESKEREYFYRNRKHEQIDRSFRFSEIDENAIEGNYENGVLHIKLPILVPEEKQPRKIEIK